MQARLVKEQNELTTQYQPLHTETMSLSQNNPPSGSSPLQDHRPHLSREDSSK